MLLSSWIFLFLVAGFLLSVVAQSSCFCVSPCSHLLTELFLGDWGLECYVGQLRRLRPGGGGRLDVVVEPGPVLGVPLGDPVT